MLDCNTQIMESDGPSLQIGNRILSSNKVNTKAADALAPCMARSINNYGVDCTSLSVHLPYFILL